ncbi:MAG TPA: hypothetical protein VHE30_20825 [Polyangiaceae bacterium]|nr:hypothetical protein [Polyangiaceae bacterium]
MTLPVLHPLVNEATARAFDAFARSGSGPPGDAYYSVEARRFELRATDLVLAAPDVAVAPASCGVRLSSPRASAAIDVCGVSPESARRALAVLDGRHTAAEAEHSSGVSPAEWRAFVDGTFGSLLFAPAAVHELELRVPGVEIVRFAGSPYEIVRAYWENMAAVTEAVARDLPAGLASDEAFLAFLRRLHVLALVGESGSSFYRPASPVAFRRGGTPGDLLLEGCVLEGDGPVKRFVSGPRVGAGAVGGAHHHSLLAETSTDRETAGDEDEDGRVVLARADGDPEAAPWFCPPRPLDLRHFAALRAALAPSLSSEDPLPSLARFHRRFVRTHPFPFANQSIAMSLVNHVLRVRRGAGLSHHVLDHLALRLSEAAYERVFAVAVEAWLVVDENRVSRTLSLVERKRRAFSFLVALAAEPSLEAARTLVRARPDDATLVLVSSARGRG